MRLLKFPLAALAALSLLLTASVASLPSPGVRAPVDHIAAPPFPRGVPWINIATLRMDQQIGHPVLIEFWDFCRVNSIRTLPYMRAWLFAAAWVALQIWDAVAVGELASGIAYATHLAGFVIGLVAGAAWKEFALDTDRLIAELT